MSLMQRGIRVGWLLLSVALLPCVAQAQDSPSTVVARQGGATVTLGDIDTFAHTIPEARRPGFFDSPERLQTLIATLLVKKQLAAEARALGLDKDPLMAAFDGPASEDALAKARMERFRTDLKIPDMSELASEEYLAHPDKYAVTGKLEVKQILVSTRSRSDAEAKARAELVEGKAKADPGQFDALIEEYSDEPDKQTMHGIVEAANNKYIPELEAPAKALKAIGDISPVLKTVHGYRVIKLVERTPTRQQTFAEVREQIIARLRTDYVEKQARNHTDILRNGTIDANPDVVASLRTRYAKDKAAVPPAHSKASE